MIVGIGHAMVLVSFADVPQVPIPQEFSPGGTYQNPPPAAGSGRLSAWLGGPALCRQVAPLTRMPME